MKLRFRNILVVQSAGSSSIRAIELAVALTREKGGRIKVVDVSRKPTWIWRELASEQWMADAQQAQLQAIHNLVAEVGAAEQNIEVELLNGRPINEIVKLVDSGDHDLVIKDAVAETAEFFFGSLDMRLLRYCPVPVLLTRPNWQGSFRKILAAIDPESDPDRADLNIEIIRQASALAKLNGAELHVASTWDSPGFNFDHSDDNVDRYESLSKSVRRTAYNNLQAILGQSLDHIDQQKVYFSCSNPADFIIDVAARIQPDLLVLGSQTRIAVPGVLIGNTAEKVLRHVDCAVMTMKPTGFVSPILN